MLTQLKGAAETEAKAKSGLPAFNLKWWDFQKGRASSLSRVRSLTSWDLSPAAMALLVLKPVEGLVLQLPGTVRAAGATEALPDGCACCR